MTNQETNPTLEINGKEYELKLTFEGIDYLNKSDEGGALSLVGKVFTGDLGTYVKIVFACLKYTGENFSFETVEQAIKESIKNEKLDLDKVMKDGNTLVANNFFYKKTVDKLLKDEGARKAMEDLLS
ncbi:tail assembly chaperone [Listeria monocytogenes]